MRAYPHELSGGMRQRVMIAMALSCEPALLIADEPTTALDVTTQAQILAQLKELRERTRMGMLLVTHDLGVVADVADRILVMHAGRLVEQGEATAILHAPQHPYTQSLLAAYAPRAPRGPRAPGAPLLEAQDLRVRFHAGGRVRWAARGRASVPMVDKRPTDVHALDGVSLTLHEGETLGVVGESGAGKTTLIRCLLRLQDPQGGTIAFRGEDITTAKRRQLAPVRRELQMVFQDAHASLNPRRRVEWILQTGLQLRGVPAADVRNRAAELLQRVGLRAEHLDRFPHELSGGERQRVGIARALSSEPKVLVLDEPVSSLDATVRAQVLDLLVRLQAEEGLGYLLVTHDLLVARGVCDRVAVMRAGRVVELAPTEQLFRRPPPRVHTRCSPQARLDRWARGRYDRWREWADRAGERAAAASCCASTRSIRRATSARRRSISRACWTGRASSASCSAPSPAGPTSWRACAAASPVRPFAIWATSTPC